MEINKKVILSNDRTVHPLFEVP